MPNSIISYFGFFFSLLTVATIIGLALKVLGVVSWGLGAILAPWLFTVGAVIAYVIVVVLVVSYADISLDEDDENM